MLITTEKSKEKRKTELRISRQSIKIYKILLYLINKIETNRENKNGKETISLYYKSRSIYGNYE